MSSKAADTSPAPAMDSKTAEAAARTAATDGKATKAAATTKAAHGTAAATKAVAATAATVSAKTTTRKRRRVRQSNQHAQSNAGYQSSDCYLPRDTPPKAARFQRRTMLHEEHLRALTWINSRKATVVSRCKGIRGAAHARRGAADHASRKVSGPARGPVAQQGLGAEDRGKHRQRRAFNDIVRSSG